MPVDTVLPELALLAGAVATLLAALVLPRSAQSWCAGVALAVLVAVAALTWAQIGEAPYLTFAGSYAVDGMAIVTRLILLGVAALSVAASVGPLHNDAREGEFYALLLLATLGSVLLAGGADLMEVVLGILLTSVASYVLVGYERTSPRSTEAAMKYFLFGALTNGAMLYGFALLYGLSGETLLGPMREALPSGFQPALGLGLALAVAGIGFKIAMVPVHFWMPDVLDGARAPVGGFISVAPKIAGLVALARLLSVMPADGLEWPLLVALVAAATMTLGNLAALRQDSVKRLLAYSSISQAGYLLMALPVLETSKLALPSLLYYFVAYALANIGAFAVVGAVGERVESFAGLARTQPALALGTTILLLSLVGLPPLAGFVAKLAIFGAAIDGGYGWLALIAAVNTVVSLFYYLRIIAPMYLEPGAERATAFRAGWLQVTVVAACVLGAVAVGVGSGFLFTPLDGMILLP